MSNNDQITMTQNGHIGRSEMLVYLKIPRSFVLFCIYIAILILLPSGSIFGFNVKIVIFIPLVLLALSKMTRKVDGLRQIAISLAILASLLFWIFVAQIYGFSNLRMSLAQYKDVATTLIGCWFVRLFTATEEDRYLFIRLCVFCTAFLGFGKVTIFCYSMLTGSSISSVMEVISYAFGVKLMSFDLGEALGRIQFPSDTLIPICLFTVLGQRKLLKLNGLTSLFLVILLIASAAFSFSRFLWGFTSLAALLGVLVSKKDRILFFYLGVSSLVGFYYSTALLSLIQIRFSDQVVDSSDADRILQSSALKSFFHDAPLIGHGFGSFTNIVIRQPDLPYNYEMQLLALSTQIGMVGILVLTCLLGNYYAKVFTFAKGSRLYQFAVLLLLTMFLAGALFDHWAASLADR